ncbi:OmpA family protein [candidate division KSB3 bacterium]|uniref:OmpA family protein n=1 Tax=candidate division KSB3 bacterium TaxID=2044937 RepID=A0A9D5Q6F6_9BACT|nr:OmpA family protein [candidate division KSB3 bacterium]MBD3325695.1 OmpA family protein [candidate division KSB3 bacterium]
MRIQVFGHSRIRFMKHEQSFWRRTRSMRHYAFPKLMIGVICLSILATPLTSMAQQRPRQSAPPETRKIVPQPRETINIDLWFDKQCGASYRQGEKIILNFRTNVDSYVTLYDIDTRGRVSVLFPNRNQPDNFVRGGQTYTIPNQSYSYDLIVEGPEGIEYVDAVASTDSYYHWNYTRGEPPWVRDWGLKGRDFSSTSSSGYQRSPEYKNRPEELGSTGEQSLARNFGLSNQLRDQIRSKIVTRPRVIESPRQPRQEDYGTATCYFYVVSAAPPTPRPYPSREDYLRQQERDFQQIPGFDAQRSGERLIVTIPDTILFDFDSYALRYEARRDLDRVADILMRYPETTVTVAGHTDSIGNANYNQRLSEYRAQSVANYLVSRGVHAYRISSVGYGESMPIASNATESGRQRNRRVELDIRVNSQYGM